MRICLSWFKRSNFRPLLFQELKQSPCKSPLFLPQSVSYVFACIFRISFQTPCMDLWEVCTRDRLLTDICIYRSFVFWWWWKTAQNNEIFCFAAEATDIDTTSAGATTSDSLPGETPTFHGESCSQGVNTCTFRHACSFIFTFTVLKAQSQLTSHFLSHPPMLSCAEGIFSMSNTGSCPQHFSNESSASLQMLEYVCGKRPVNLI